MAQQIERYGPKNPIMKTTGDNDREVIIHGPKSVPCSECPFRNTSVAHAEWMEAEDEFRAIWKNGMRTGGVNTCHRGTPHEEMPRPSYSKMTQCAGSVVVQQREALRLQKRAPHIGWIDTPGMTYKGAHAVIWRMLTNLDGTKEDRRRGLGGLSRKLLLSLAHPSLNDPAIGHPESAPVEPGEFEEQ